jgi:DNA mismatch endonuclease, patch repair protein
MTDNLSPADRKRAMQAVKSKATKLEKKLCGMLAGMRLKGWKKNPQQITGKPDIAFPSERVAIFVDGCFWHCCPTCRRKMPITNTDYWERKIHRNVTLASKYNRQLRREGWIVVRIWEHEMRDRTRARLRVRAAISNRSAKSG